MKRLVAKLLIFSVPFAVILLLPAAIMQASGEFTRVGTVIALQSDSAEPVLFGRAYSDPTARYKLESVLQRKPEIVILGTSRVLALRSALFDKEVRVFNAGNGVTRLRHYRLFLRKLPPDRTPRVIVLGLDQYLFNSNFDSLAPDDMEEQWNTERPRRADFFASWKTLYADHMRGKFAVKDIFASTSERRIGINAIVHANAFRNDGSYNWGQLIANPADPENPDYGFQNTFDRIAKGDRRFQYAEHVAEDNVAELRRFLADCRDRNIHVVAFLPPFAHAVYEKMRSMPIDYGYLSALPARLQPVFAEFGYTFFDFSDLASLGSPDSETIDGFHGSEKAYVRLFVRLIEGDPVLRSFARDPDYLIARIERASGDHQVFSIDE